MKSLRAAGLLLPLSLLACHPKAASTPPPVNMPSWQTPEEVLQNTSPGTTVTVRGNVFAVTFDNIHDPSKDPNGGYTPKNDRYVLIRTVVPDNVQDGTDLRTDDDTMLKAWGLGLLFDEASLKSRALTLPQLGDQVEVTGTFQQVSWNNTMRPVLTGLTSFKVVQGQPALADRGQQACNVDMDCRDELICVRASKTCDVPPHTDWGDSWRDVNGACDTDDDCPTGQVCDLTYTMSPEDKHPLSYNVGNDTGRHLCVPDPNLTMAQLCPRTVTAEDLSSGRFALGKEICVSGEILLTTVPQDGDTHTQMKTPEPLVMPLADAPYYIFGSVNENSPPYKNSNRMGGALTDPSVNEKLISLGTYRYDPGHGWFEVHPMKMWWPVQ